MNRPCLLFGIAICIALLVSIDGSDVERHLLTLTKWAEGENIGYGHQTPDAAVIAWRRSPSHCVNLMNGQFDSFGGGRVETYWVQKFVRGCR